MNLNQADLKFFEQVGSRSTQQDFNPPVNRKSRSDQYCQDDFQEVIPMHANRMSPYYPRFMNNPNVPRLQMVPKVVRYPPREELSPEQRMAIQTNHFRINQSKIILQNGNYIICNASNMMNTVSNHPQLPLFGSRLKQLKTKVIVQKKTTSIMKRKQQEAQVESDQKSNQGTQIIEGMQNSETDRQQLMERQNDQPSEELKQQKNTIDLKSPMGGQIAVPLASFSSQKVSSQRKSKISNQLQLNERDKTKMQNYFRHHLMSLLGALTKKENYMEFLKDGKILKTTNPKRTDRKLPSGQQGILNEILNKVQKLLSTKGRYKYRERFNFQNSNQLKSIAYDVKKRLKDQEKVVKTLQKCVSKEDIEEEDQNSPPKKSKQIQQTGPYIADLSTWKKKNNLHVDDKVYIVKGGYSVVKQGLEERGWIENPDVYSPFFDFKYTCKLADIDFVNLDEYQIVNHFDNNLALTSKFGLCRSLKTLIWYEDCDIDTFYPRCYDLGDLTDFEDFIEDFKVNKAESILISFATPKKEDLEVIPESNTPQKNSQDGTALLIESVKLRLAILIIRRKLCEIIDTIEQIYFEDSYPMVSSDEWELLRDDTKKIPIQKWQSKDQQLTKQEMPNFPDWDKFKTYYEPIVEALITQLKQFEPQFNLNGHRNIWILKPNFLSRGRGIKCFNQIEKILDHIIGKDTQYVIQKYMENPMIIKSKKFDIRQWVLVQDYDPPRIWFFDECYIRFSAEEFDIDNLNNRFIHLTNNSIAKNSGNFNQGDIKGNMWTQDQFADYLKEINGRDVFYEDIQPRMKQIIILTIKSAQDQIKSRRNSMELFGYDFMIDEHNTPWLIEINSSPSMDYSTHVTQRLVPLVLEDTLKVVIDYTLAKKGTKKQVDTGMFKLIYKGETNSKPNPTI